MQPDYHIIYTNDPNYLIFINKLFYLFLKKY